MPSSEYRWILRLIVLVVLIKGIWFHPREAWAFRISSPANGAVIEAGSNVSVQVDTEGTTRLVGVLFATSGEQLGGEFDAKPPFEWEVQIPMDYLGSLTFTAMGRIFGQGTDPVPQAEVTVRVVLPPSIILQGLQVHEDQETLFMRVGAKEKIYLYGQFSDGVKRNISSSATGTMYQTSDARIATVDTEGLVTAIAPGKAVIITKNGNRQIQIGVQIKAR
jgi:hypothetical protein